MSLRNEIINIEHLINFLGNGLDRDTKEDLRSLITKARRCIRDNDSKAQSYINEMKSKLFEFQDISIRMALADKQPPQKIYDQVLNNLKYAAREKSKGNYQAARSFHNKALKDL